MATRRKQIDSDIRLIFDRLADAVLLDDMQFGAVTGSAPSTIKRWRRQKKLPPAVRLNGRPRYRVGDIREWLKGEYPSV
jgi:hypothetical protein